MKFRFQYKKNQISIFDNYEKTKQKSNFNENEKYQFDKKKTNSKITTNKTKMNQKIKTNMNLFKYLILLDFKLATILHIKLKLFVRKRISVFFSNKKNFNCLINFIFRFNLK